MPFIIFTDGSKHYVPYSKASETMAYLDELPGYKLDTIEDAAKREKIRAFLERVAKVDFTDIRTKKDNPISPRRENIRAVMEDKSITGKAKFYAMRDAMGVPKKVFDIREEEPNAPEQTTANWEEVPNP